jgi:hypothetical protein
VASCLLKEDLFNDGYLWFKTTYKGRTLSSKQAGRFPYVLSCQRTGHFFQNVGTPWLS